MGDLAESEPEIIQQPILEVVDEPVDPHLLPLLPGLLDYGDPRQVIHLLFNVELAQEVLVLLLVGTVELVPVLRPGVPDVREPGLERPVVVLLEGSPDSPAVVVPGYDDVLDFEHLDRVLDDCEQVDIRGRSHVSHVPMHEELARLQPHYLVGGHSRVGAADPEVLGGLNMGKALEVLGVVIDHSLRPFPIVLHDLFEVVHDGGVAAEEGQLRSSGW